MSFTWSAPEDNGDSPILNYSVEQYVDTTGKFIQVDTVTQTSYTSVSGLPENTGYQFRVRAQNSAGFGDYSSKLSIATLIGTIGTVQHNDQSTIEGYIYVNGKSMITLANDDDPVTLYGT